MGSYSQPVADPFGGGMVTPNGRIVFGEQSNVVREKVKSLIAEGKKKIVLR